MTDESTAGTSAARVARRPRSDVQRNLAALTAAAKDAFAAGGVGVPAKEITDRAGVGVGTLYRHFPKRSDLIVAVLQSELDACIAEAATVGATLPPWEALTAWLDRYAGLVATKQGLAEALHSADPAYDGLPASILVRLEAPLDGLLARCRAEGSVRPDADAGELLTAVALLCHDVPGRDAAFTRRLVGVFVDGLRPAPAEGAVAAHDTAHDGDAAHDRKGATT